MLNEELSDVLEENKHVIEGMKKDGVQKSNSSRGEL